MKLTLFFISCIFAITGCRSVGPSVDAVWSKSRIMTVAAGDQDAFLTDRASRLRTEGKFLPPDQQGEEFFVKWHGKTVDLVKFEYRQLNAPDKIGTQEFRPKTERSHVFVVAGDVFRRGGQVSGWRASLWCSAPACGGGDQMLAELKSSLW